jgi:hypothetical protein
MKTTYLTCQECIVLHTNTSEKNDDLIISKNFTIAHILFTINIKSKTCNSTDKNLDN